MYGMKCESRLINFGYSKCVIFYWFFFVIIDICVCVGVYIFKWNLVFYLLFLILGIEIGSRVVG